MPAKFTECCISSAKQAVDVATGQLMCVCVCVCVCLCVCV